MYLFFGSRTFVPFSWMCKKQASVSHWSTESEIISFDAGLRLDGSTCSKFMGCGDRSVTFIEQYQTTNQSRSRKLFAQNRDVDQLSHVDRITTNAFPSPHNHEQTSHVMFTRGTNRFVDEVHDHKVEVRSSTELLSALQNSEGRESWVCARHVTSRYGNKEACANNLSSPPNFSSLFKKGYHSTERKEVVVILRQFFVWRCLFESCIRNAYKDGTSLRPRRTRTWWVISLGYRKFL